MQGESLESSARKSSRLEVHYQPAEIISSVLNATTAILAIHLAVPDIYLIEKRRFLLQLDVHVAEERIDGQSFFDAGTVRDHVEAIKKIGSDCILGSQL